MVSMITEFSPPYLRVPMINLQPAIPLFGPIAGTLVPFRDIGWVIGPFFTHFYKQKQMDFGFENLA